MMDLQEYLDFFVLQETNWLLGWKESKQAFMVLGLLVSRVDGGSAIVKSM